MINSGPAGYSDMAVAEDGGVFCLFENGVTVYREKISIVEVPR